MSGDSVVRLAGVRVQPRVVEPIRDRSDIIIIASVVTIGGGEDGVVLEVQSLLLAVPVGLTRSQFGPESLGGDKDLEWRKEGRN